MAEGALGASEADLDGGIFLRSVELGREEHPGQHILAVDGLDIAHLGLVRRDLAEYAVVLASDALRLGSVEPDSDQFVREVHRAITCEQRGDAILLNDCPGGVEVVPESVTGQAAYRPATVGEIGPVDGLEAFGKGVEIDSLAVVGPYEAYGIVLEIGSQFAALAERYAVPVDADVLHHDARLVGLVALAFHTEPGDALSVRGPDGVGVIAAVHLDALDFARRDAIDVYLGIRGECVLLAHSLAATIGDEAPVRAPGELFRSAEGLGREFVRLVSEQVEGVVRSDRSACERGDISARSLSHPVVPVTVHQILGGIGLGLVKQRVALRRSLYGAVIDGADIQDVALVGREFELADSGGNVTDLDFFTKFRTLERGLPYLASLEEVDLLPVKRPAGVGDALGVTGQLDLVSTVDIAQEEVAAAAVVSDGGVTDSVEHLGPVRGDLRVGEPSEGQHHLRGHPSVGDGDVRRSDVTAFVVLFLVATHCSEEDCDGAAHCTEMIDSHMIGLFVFVSGFLQFAGHPAAQGKRGEDLDLRA